MTAQTKVTRRSLLQAAAMVTPVAMAGCAATPENDDLMLRADDPVARALLYYPDSRDVPAGHPLATTHEPSQTCAGCIHNRGAAGGGQNCPVFPGRLVSAGGWCSVWAKA